MQPRRRLVMFICSLRPTGLPTGRYYGDIPRYATHNNVQKGIIFVNYIRPAIVSASYETRLRLHAA